ncbi:MAG: fatty acyl-AMP ligase, partial [Anaerolineales bacterium]
AQAGVGTGEPVVIILQHGRALIEAFFGAVLYGAIPAIMPFLTEKMSPDRYRESLSSLMEITRPAAIITYPEFVPQARRAIRSANFDCTILLPSDVTTISELMFDCLSGAKRSTEDLVLLQHSSGTTGLQKGVALSHKAVLKQVYSYADAIHMTHEDIVVNWLPLYHDMGLIAGFLMPILLRATLVLMSPFDWVRAPHRLLQAVSRYRGTLSWLPNFAYNFCALKVRDRNMEGVSLSSWRAVINCSEPMRWKSHKLFLERFERYGLRREALATCYAMAENVFAVTQGGIGCPVVVDEVDRQAMQEKVARPAQNGSDTVMNLSAGRPISITQVRILGEDRRELPERHIGEIAIQGTCMLSGYYNRDDLTKQAFHEGWYLTGDLGYLANGELFVTGRLKDLIIVGGKNIYPLDLEELAGEVSGVHPGRVVAFGVFNETLGTEEIAIVAEVDNNDPQERRRIAEEIRQEIARGSDVTLRYSWIVDRKWLIKTSSGKLSRRANCDKFLAEAKLA